MKNVFFGILLAFASMASLVAITPAQVSANCNERLLTFPTWYRGLVDEDSRSCNIKAPSGQNGLRNFITTIILNILEIAIQAVAYISLGYLLWGSYTYIRTVSNSNNITRARQMIQNAVIGLIISLAAVVIISFIIGRIT